MSQLKRSPTSLHAFVPSAIQIRSSRLSSSSRRVYVLPRILSTATPIGSNQAVVRRSAEYKPSIWGHDFIQSLKTEYDMQEESRIKYRNKLKEDVRVVIKEYGDKDILHQFELIDTLQRLGLSYHFEDEIKMILEKVYSDHIRFDYGLKKDGLYAKALKFKLLRQHGYYVPQDIFNDFRDKSGNFKASIGEECDKAMLYLYEASFLSMEGENTLHEAKTFTKKHLGDTEESRTKYRNKLKEDVRVAIKEYGDKDILHQLELIDTLQRLGLSYHFEDEIKMILEKVYSDHVRFDYGLKKDGLYAKALKFKLLRQYGYYVPQDIFNDFRDKSGNFKASIGEECDKAMLYLYEASFLSMEGENILHEAKTFTKKHLSEYLKRNENKDQHLFTLVEHALEFPLHWRMLRMEARWFIEVYQQNPDMNPMLLDLAKLDFNMIQSVYQEDLKHDSMWWKKTGLGENLGFIRDRLVENFLWTTGIFFQPKKYGYFRRMMTQINALITTIDDVYDVYGTLDELELFTDVVERWDINTIEQLPYYMKLCFFALHNSMNQMASDIFQEQGINILPYSKKAWTDLCKCYMIEAKWYHTGYKPTLQEYLENGVVSISAPLILVHAYAFTTNHIKKDVLQYLENDIPNIIRCSSMVLRLGDDLGTSSAEMSRGDTPKSIQCYMHDTGASEEEAREYIRGLIAITWEKMNKEVIETSPLIPPNLIEASLNLARMAQFMYKHGDGHSSQDHIMRKRVLALLVNPIGG